MKVHEDKMSPLGYEPIPVHTRQEHVIPPWEPRPVATLKHGLDKVRAVAAENDFVLFMIFLFFQVLFTPGVHPFRDKEKKNHFPLNLHKIHQPEEIDFNVLPPFITTSRDNVPIPR